MKPGAWHGRARELSRSGLTIREIAGRCGVTYSAVYKALNPHRARVYGARDNARPGRREAKAAWLRTAGSCVDCGGSCGYGHGRCRPCWLAHIAVVREVRLSVVEGMWAAGWPLLDIADALGYGGDEFVRASKASWTIGKLRELGRAPYRNMACLDHR